MKVTICANHRCPIKHKCGKVFEPEEIRGTIEYKFFHFSRNEGGQVSCGDFSPRGKHGR